MGIKMKITELEVKGVYYIENIEFFDNRGEFVKVFNDDFFKRNEINFSPKEIFYSISHKNVIRGMHFQIPPFEHAKLIYVTAGKIIDVILDIRKKSATFGKAISVNLEANKNSIFIPVGCAHGFQSLEDNSVVVYNQTSTYSKEHDGGILWNSFRLDWGIDNPIISERDKSFPVLQDYDSPF
jgi:dTDP-4-dehydrorhamnose 3,5-epimerase